MRLIDADDDATWAREHILDAKERYAILDFLRNCSTITPESLVRHGQWLGSGDGYADGEIVYDTWECSECGHFEDKDDPKFLPRFCPHCGAKMDLEET